MLSWAFEKDSAQTEGLEIYCMRRYYGPLLDFFVSIDHAKQPHQENIVIPAVGTTQTALFWQSPWVVSRNHVTKSCVRSEFTIGHLPQ